MSRVMVFVGFMFRWGFSLHAVAADIIRHSSDA
jgi:preprotein translocase subunit SecF